MANACRSSMIFVFTPLLSRSLFSWTLLLFVVVFGITCEEVTRGHHGRTRYRGRQHDHQLLSESLGLGVDQIIDGVNVKVADGLNSQKGSSTFSGQGQDLQTLRGEIIDLNLLIHEARTAIARPCGMEPDCVMEKTTLHRLVSEAKKKIQEIHQILRRSDGHDTAQSTKNIDGFGTLRRQKRAAIADKSLLWKDGVIPYVINKEEYNGHTNDLFIRAMRHIEEKTCLVFKEKEPHDVDYIIIKRGICGCCASVGRQGGQQEVTLSSGCFRKGIVIHELMHAIGFHHEHQRPDRDQFINIIFNNIQDGERDQFRKKNKSEVDTMGSPYDFDSIMHYGRNKWSKQHFLDTIQTIRQPNKLLPPLIGQRNGLSTGDVQQTLKLYNCPRCGGTLVDTKGEIGNRGRSMRCQWRVLAAPGQRIEMNITQLTPRDCNSGHVDFREDVRNSSTSLGTVCGDILPSSVTSHGHRLWVDLKTPRSGGFMASYEMKCGGVLTGTGLINSPGYPTQYVPGIDCEWVVEVEQGHTVVLEFFNFGTEYHQDCDRDYLEIRDGADKNARLLGKLCGDQLPEAVQSSADSLYIRFVSDEDVSGVGFSVLYMGEIDECEQEGKGGCEGECVNMIGSYKCTCKLGFELHTDGRGCEKECGGLIDDASGQISSPSFPDNYPPKKKCVWLLNTFPGQKITINFTSFDLESNYDGDCDYDYITVKNVDGIKEDVIGNYCGKTLPPTITSKANQMRIEFTSDETSQHTGFSLNYFSDLNECENNNGGCDQICTNTKASYMCACREGFDLQEDGMKCKHQNICATDNGGCQHICENPEDGFRCICHDGFVLEDDGKRCRRRHECEDNNGGCQQTCQRTTGGFQCACRDGYALDVDGKGCRKKKCYFKKTEATGIVQSPNYPKRYPARKDCEWLFRTAPGHRVKLWFTDFRLEPHRTCKYDRMKLLDGGDLQATSLGTYCGYRQPPTTISSTNNLTMMFFSDASVQRKGFQAEYDSVCGGKMSATSEPQVFVSHVNYQIREDYDKFENCEWEIEASEGQRVLLKFVEFDIEADERCIYDNVTVNDGHQRHVKCGDQMPSPITSVGNSMVVHFRSDHTLQHGGFSATYQTVDDPMTQP